MKLKVEWEVNERAQGREAWEGLESARLKVGSEWVVVEDAWERLRFKSGQGNPRFKVNGSRAECYERKSNESKGERTCQGIRLKKQWASREYKVRLERRGAQENERDSKRGRAVPEETEWMRLRDKDSREVPSRFKLGLHQVFYRVYIGNRSVHRPGWEW